MLPFAEDQPDKGPHELPLTRHEPVVGRDNSQENHRIQVARMVGDNNGAVLVFKMLETGHTQRTSADDEDATGPSGHETHRSFARFDESKRDPERRNDRNQDGRYPRRKQDGTAGVMTREHPEALRRRPFPTRAGSLWPSALRQTL